jgi:hypothetical protein
MGGICSIHGADLIPVENFGRIDSKKSLLDRHVDNIKIGPGEYSLVGIATGYWLSDQVVGARVPAASRMFSSPLSPDRFWGPPNLLYSGYGRPFPGGKAVGT